MNLYPFAPLPGKLGELRVRASLSRVVGDPLSLDWRFEIQGDISALLLPRGSRGSTERKTGLWEHTCFEVFLKSPWERSYLELNYAPGGAWSAFHFDDYRQAMRDDLEVSQLTGDLKQTESLLSGSVRVARKKTPWARELCAGLTCVLESRDRALSYWALVHTDAQPNFHFPNSFICRL